MTSPSPAPLMTMGLSGGAALRQIVSAVERRAVGRYGAVEAAVDETVVFIKAGVHQNGVARLDARRQLSVRMVGLVGARVVSSHQASERRLLLRSFVSERIYVIDVAARRRLGSGACAPYGLLSLAFQAVGIRENKTAFVFRARFRDSTGFPRTCWARHSYRSVPRRRAGPAGHVFVLQAQQRLSLYARACRRVLR